MRGSGLLRYARNDSLAQPDVTLLSRAVSRRLRVTSPFSNEPPGQSSNASTISRSPRRICRPVSSMGVAVDDVSGDGRPDVFVTALKGETFPLYVNDGAMTFHDGTHQARLAGPTSQRSGWGVTLADLDNDGRPDIATANSHVNDRIDQFEASSYKEPNAVLINRGNGFEEVTAQVGEAFGRTAAAHRGLIAADLDNDGRQDLVTTSLGGPVEVWRNGGPAGHWLRIVLHGLRGRSFPLSQSQVDLHDDVGRLLGVEPAHHEEDVFVGLDAFQQCRCTALHA